MEPGRNGGAGSRGPRGGTERASRPPGLAALLTALLLAALASATRAGDTNSHFRIVSGGLGGLCRGSAYTEEDPGVPSVQIVGGSKDAVGYVSVMHLGDTVAAGYTVTCNAVASITGAISCPVPAGTGKGQVVDCVTKLVSGGTNGALSGKITCKGPVTPVAYDGVNSVASTDTHTFKMRPVTAGTGGTALAVKLQAGGLQKVDGKATLATDTALGQTDATTPWIVEGVAAAEFFKADAPSGARLTCLSVEAATGLSYVMPPAGETAAAQANVISSAGFGSFAIASSVTGDKTETVTCGVTTAAGVPAEAPVGDFTTFQVFVKDTANARWAVVSGGLGLSSIARGTTLGAGAGVPKVARVFADRDAVGFVAIKHLGEATTAPYTVTCGAVANFIRDTACVVPAGTAKDTVVDCVLKLADASAVGGGLRRLSQTLDTSAPITCTQGGDQHVFTLEVVEAGTGGVALAVQMQIDGVQSTGTGTLVAGTAVTQVATPATSPFFVKNVSGVLLFKAVASTGAKLQCHSVSASGKSYVGTPAESTAAAANAISASGMGTWGTGEVLVDTAVETVTCGVTAPATTATQAVIGDFYTFDVTVANKLFQIVGGGLGGMTSSDILDETTKKPAIAAKAYTSSNDVAVGVIAVRHLGGVTTAAYSVTCTGATDFTSLTVCVVPKGTIPGTAVPCALNLVDSSSRAGDDSAAISCAGTADVAPIDAEGNSVATTTKPIGLEGYQTFKLTAVTAGTTPAAVRLVSAGVQAADRTSALANSTELTRQDAASPWIAESQAGAALFRMTLKEGAKATCFAVDAASGASGYVVVPAGESAAADVSDAVTLGGFATGSVSGGDKTVSVTCGVTTPVAAAAVVGDLVNFSVRVADVGNTNWQVVGGGLGGVVAGAALGVASNIPAVKVVGGPTDAVGYIAIKHTRATAEVAYTVTCGATTNIIDETACVVPAGTDSGTVVQCVTKLVTGGSVDVNSLPIVCSEGDDRHVFRMVPRTAGIGGATLVVRNSAVGKQNDCTTTLAAGSVLNQTSGNFPCVSEMQVVAIKADAADGAKITCAAADPLTGLDFVTLPGESPEATSNAITAGDFTAGVTNTDVTLTISCGVTVAATVAAHAVVGDFVTFSLKIKRSPTLQILDTGASGGGSTVFADNVARLSAPGATTYSAKTGQVYNLKLKNVTVAPSARNFGDNTTQTVVLTCAFFTDRSNDEPGVTEAADVFAAGATAAAVEEAAGPAAAATFTLSHSTNSSLAIGAVASNSAYVRFFKPGTYYVRCTPAAVANLTSADVVDFALAVTSNDPLTVYNNTDKVEWQHDNHLSSSQGIKVSVDTVYDVRVRNASASEVGDGAAQTVTLTCDLFQDLDALKKPQTTAPTAIARGDKTQFAAVESAGAPNVSQFVPVHTANAKLAAGSLSAEAVYIKLFTAGIYYVTCVPTAVAGVTTSDVINFKLVASEPVGTIAIIDASAAGNPVLGSHNPALLSHGGGAYSARVGVTYALRMENTGAQKFGDGAQAITVTCLIRTDLSGESPGTTPATNAVKVDTTEGTVTAAASGDSSQFVVANSGTASLAAGAVSDTSTFVRFFAGGTYYVACTPGAALNLRASNVTNFALVVDAPVALVLTAQTGALLDTGYPAADGSTVLFGAEEPGLLVYSGSPVSDLNAQLVLKAARDLEAGKQFTLTCTSSDTEVIGSAAARTYTGAADTNAAQFEYKLDAATAVPVTIAAPPLTGGSTCQEGTICGTGDVTVTCEISDSTAEAYFSDAAGLQYKIKVLPDRPAGEASTVRCSLKETVAGSGLDVLSTTATDSAEAIVSTTPLELRLLAGTAARTPMGRAIAPDTVLKPTHGVEAIENKDYGNGGLLKVAFSLGTLPEALTVTCKLDQAQSSAMAYAVGTSTSQYTKSFTTGAGNGTTAQSLTLPAVSLTLKAPTDVTYTCTARNAAGRVFAMASTTVVATPLRILITAGTAALDTAGSPVAENTVLSGTSTTLIKRPTAAEAVAGTTFKVALSGSPGENVVIKCETSDVNILPVDLTTQELTFTPGNGTDGQGLKLGANGSITDETDEVTVTCTLKADVLDSGLEVAATTASDTASAIVKLTPFEISILAGYDAVDAATGGAVAEDTVVSGTAIKLERVEGQEDNCGLTVRAQVTMRTNATVTIDCLTTTGDDKTTIPDQAVDGFHAVTFGGTTDTTTKTNVKLGTVASISVEKDVVLRCNVTAATGGVTWTGFAETTITAKPLAIQILAGSSAVDAETQAAVVAGTPVGPAKLLRVEGQVDAPGGTLRVRLNGNPTASVQVACRSAAPASLPDSADASDYTLEFAPTTGTTPQGIKLGTVTDVDAEQALEVALDCAVTADAGGLTPAEKATATVKVEELKVLIVAGSAAVDAATSRVVPTGDPVAGKTLERVEGQVDVAGGTLEIRLNADPTADVVVVCASGNEALLPNLGTGLRTATFTPTSGTVARGITLGTVPTSIGGADEVKVTCTPSTTAGITAAEVATVDVSITPLKIIIVAGTAAVSDADGQAMTPGDPVGATKLRRIEAQADSTGLTLALKLNGKPGAGITVSCTSGTTATLPDATAGDYEKLFATSYDLSTSQPLKLGTVASIGVESDVVITCVVKSNVVGSGLTTGDGDKATVTIRAVPIQLLIEAGTSAVDASTGEAILQGTLLSGSDIKLRLVELNPDTAGATIQVKLTGTPTSGIEVECATGAAALPDPEGGVNTVTLTNAVAQAVTLGTAALAVNTTDVAVTCKATASGLGDMSSSVIVVATQLQVVVAAGTSAIGSVGLGVSSGTVLSATGAPIVSRPEYDLDTAGGTLQIKLTGKPGATVTIVCASQNITRLSDPTGGVNEASFTDAEGLVLKDITLGTAVPAPARGDFVIKEAGLLFAAHVEQADLLGSTTTVDVIGNDTYTLKLTNGSGSAFPAEKKVTCTAYEDTNFKVLAETTFKGEDPGTTVASFSFTNGATALAPGAELSDATTVPIAPKSVLTTVYVRCLSNATTSGWGPDVFTSFKLVIGPEMNAVAGTNAIEDTPTGSVLADEVTVLAVGERCKTPVIFEGHETGAGEVVKLGFGRPISQGQADCVSSDPTLLPSILALDITTGAGTIKELDFAAPGPTKTPKTVRFTCTVKPQSFSPSAPEPIGITVGADVVFEVSIRPLTLDIVVVADGTVKRKSDGAMMRAGYAVGYGAVGQPATGSASKTVVLDEGVAGTGLIALKLRTNPTSPVTFTCTSDDSDTIKRATDITVPSASDTTPMAFDIPSISGIDVDKDYVYTCVPTSTAGGFNTSSDHHVVKFIVQVRRFHLTPTAVSGSVTNAKGVALVAGQDLSAPAFNADVAVLVFEGVAGSSAKVQLQQSTTPGAPDVKVECKSSRPEILPTIPSVPISNNLTPIPVPLPAPSSVGDVDVEVKYSCFPTSTTGYLTSPQLDVAEFYIKLIAIKVQAAALSSQVLPDGLVLPAGSPLPEGKRVVVYEGQQPTTSRLGLLPNAAPAEDGKQETVEYTCVSSNEEVMASITEGVSVSGTGISAIPLPRPAAVDGSIDVDYVCTPTFSKGGIAVTETVTFGVRVANITVAAFSASEQASLSPATALSATSPLRGGDPAATPLVVEGSDETRMSAVVALKATSLPLEGATLVYKCASSNSDILKDFEVELLAATPVAASIPAVGPVDAPVTVTYTCAMDESAGGVDASQRVTFDVAVQPFAVRAVAGTDAQLGSGVVLPPLTPLVSGDESRTPVVTAGVATSKGAVVQLLPLQAPAEPLEYNCVSSSPVMASVEGVKMTVAEGAEVSLPVPKDVSAAVKVVYTCAPTADAAGLRTTEEVRFDVTVRPREIIVRAAPRLGGVPSAGRENIFSGTVLNGAGDPDRTPILYNAVSTAPGAIVTLALSVSPEEPVTVDCVSNNTAVLDSVVKITVSDTNPVQVPLPTPRVVPRPETVTYACAPVVAAGGYTVDVRAEFDVRVDPVTVDVVAGANAGNALDGTDLPPGASLAGTGNPARTILVDEESPESNLRVALRPTAPPEQPAEYYCESSNPAVMADVPKVNVGLETVLLTLPTARDVTADTTLTFVCRPFDAPPPTPAPTPAPTTPAATTPPPAPTATVAASATAAGDDTPEVDTVTIGGVWKAGDTIQVREGSTDCLAPFPVAAEDLDAGDGGGGAATHAAIAAKVATALEAGACRDSFVATAAGAVVSLAANANNATLASDYTAAVAQAPAPTPAATTAAPTTAAPTTAAPTDPAPGERSTVSNEVSFDVRVRALRLVVRAKTTARRASDLLLFPSAEEITTGGDWRRVPVIMFNEATTGASGANSVATVQLSGPGSGAEVDLACFSSSPGLLQAIPSVRVSGDDPVDVPFPPPSGAVPAGETIVTYTCKPRKDAGGLTTQDLVAFDVMVHDLGLLVLAGAAARSSTSNLAVPVGTDAGYLRTRGVPAQKPLPPVLLAVAEKVVPGTAAIRAKSPGYVTDPATGTVTETAVEVNCVSNNPGVLADFNVPGVVSDVLTDVPFPRSLPLSEDTVVTYTCTPECKAPPYQGSEAVRFDVKVLARGFLVVAGGDQLAADGTAVPEASLLVPGAPDKTPLLFEREAPAAGRVLLHATVAPTGALEVRCVSDAPDVLASLAPVTVDAAAELLGGTGVPLPLPTPGRLREDRVVLFNCAPVLPGGGYSTESVTFGVMVRRQRVLFVTGDRVYARDDRGARIPAGTPVTQFRATESGTFAAGQLVRVRALSAPVVVTCMAKVGGADPQPVFSALGATVPEIALLGTKATDLYVPSTPAVDGTPVEIVITCTPTLLEANVDNGYGPEDAASLKIVVDDVFPPNPDFGADVAVTTFDIAMVFGTEPSTAVVAAIMTEVRYAVGRQLDVPPEDVGVTRKAGARRALEEYTLELTASIRSDSATRARELADAITASRMDVVIRDALVTASKDPTSPLSGIVLPTISVSNVQSAMTPPIAVLPTGPPAAPESPPPSSTKAPDSAAAADRAAAGLVAASAAAVIIFA